MADALLRIEGLTKRFGGVVASDNVALDVTEGELHAIIGPNGAGKTTLIGQLSGEIAPDAGRIHFDGQDITALPVYSAQPAGTGALVPDHVAVSRFHRAGQCRAGRAGACRALVPLLARAREETELREPARAALERVGSGRSREHDASPA